MTRIAELFTLLAAEFEEHEIKRGGLTPQSVMNRLDVVCKPEFWTLAFQALSETLVQCALTIEAPPGEKITKHGADSTPELAFIKAAAAFGVGRYLLGSLDTPIFPKHPAAVNGHPPAREDAPEKPPAPAPPKPPSPISLDILKADPLREYKLFIRAAATAFSRRRLGLPKDAKPPLIEVTAEINRVCGDCQPGEVIESLRDFTDGGLLQKMLDQFNAETEALASIG